MSRWTAPTDPDQVVAIPARPHDTRYSKYHRLHWTGSGTHCVNWMFTRTLAQAQALALLPCGRCYHA